MDVYHIFPSIHGVALVRTKNAGLKSGALSSLEIQEPKMMQKIAICA